MYVFYSTLISTYILGLFARISYNKKFKELAIFFLVLLSINLILVSGLRSGIGDTPFYKHSYNLLVQNPSSFKFDGDFALNLLSLFLMQISTDPQILIFTVALITNILNVIMFNKYRSYLELQVYMYITSGYYITTMNGLRQCLAAALLFACTQLIIKGKFIPYCICVILISTFHESALMMLPIYFVVRQEAWSKKMVIFIGLAVVGVFGYNIISPIIFKALESTSYGHYSQFNEGGSSAMRTLVNSVPVIFAYLKRQELKEKWPDSNIFVNMSIINVIFVAFGMFNWIFNRFTLYLQLYNFVLMPYLIKNCFNGKERRLLYLGFLGCYFFFFYYEQVIGMGMSYPTNFKLKEFIFGKNYFGG